MVRHAAVVVAALFGATCVAGAHARLSAAHRMTAQSRHGWMARDANPRHPWLYVTGNQDDQVAIYDLQRVGFPKVGEITEGISSPADVAVDLQGTIYVANESGTVTVYAAEVGPATRPVIPVEVWRFRGSRETPRA